MAIAFRPPEIIANAAAPTNPSVQYTHYTTTTSSVPPPPPGVHHQSPMQSVTVQGPHTGGFVILSPSSAVIQHQGLWVSSSPQTVAAQQQQQMFGGFPPIYHNNTATVPAPQFHRVAYAMTTTTTATPAPPPATTQRTPLAPQRESLLHRCVTAAGCCTTCNDIRRGK